MRGEEIFFISRSMPAVWRMIVSAAPDIVLQVVVSAKMMNRISTMKVPAIRSTEPWKWENDHKPPRNPMPRMIMPYHILTIERISGDD